jgi:hypothetical protein
MEKPCQDASRLFRHVSYPRAGVKGLCFSSLLFSADASGRLQSAWSGSSGREHVVCFVVEALRLGAAVLAAWGVTRLAIASGLVDPAMVQTAYVDPVR